MRRLHVAIVTHYFPPEIGAPQARLSEMGRAWVEAGAKVTVVTGFPNHPTGVIPEAYRGRWTMEEERDGMRVVRCPLYATPNSGTLKKTLGHLSFMASGFLFGAGRVGRPDVVVALSPTFFSAMGAWALSRLKGCPFVFEVRDLWPGIFVELGVLKNRAAIRILEGIELFLYRQAARVVTVTDGFGDDIASRGIDAGKIVTVTNGVDLDVYRSGPRENDVRRELGLGDRFVVLYIGAHGISHSLHRIVEAAERLRDREDVVFVLVGEGAEKAKVEALQREKRLPNLILLPGQPRERVADFYHASDACLVPLRDVPLFHTFIPSKMFEIMGCERPIVGSVAGEARGILERSGAALVVDPEDAAGIAASVETLAADPERCVAMGRSGRAYASVHYDRRKLAVRYLDLFREIRCGVSVESVLVTGATGFVGPFVQRALLARGRRVGAFVRTGDPAAGAVEDGVRVHDGDLDRPETLEAALAGYDALANVASLGFGHADGIVRAAESAGVGRAAFVSTTAIFTGLNAPSKTVRTAAEATIRKSGLAWTILRPTMIYGTPGDRNISRLVRLLRGFPFLLVPGPGTNLLQPVHVEDVAGAIAEAVCTPEAASRAYDVSGASPVTFNDLVDTVGRLVGRRVLRIHVPVGCACAVASLTKPVLGRRGISAEQIHRLNEDKAFSHADATRDLGYAPRGVEEGLRDLVRLLG